MKRKAEEKPAISPGVLRVDEASEKVPIVIIKKGASLRVYEVVRKDYQLASSLSPYEVVEWVEKNGFLLCEYGYYRGFVDYYVMVTGDIKRYDDEKRLIQEKLDSTDEYIREGLSLRSQYQKQNT